MAWLSYMSRPMSAMTSLESLYSEKALHDKKKPLAAISATAVKAAKWACFARRRTVDRTGTRDRLGGAAAVFFIGNSARSPSPAGRSDLS
jgi:hypothetical protein